jgi:hypothetical protein
MTHRKKAALGVMAPIALGLANRNNTQVSEFREDGQPQVTVNNIDNGENETTIYNLQSVVRHSSNRRRRTHSTHSAASKPTKNIARTPSPFQGSFGGDVAHVANKTFERSSKLVSKATGSSAKKTKMTEWRKNELRKNVEFSKK